MSFSRLLSPFIDLSGNSSEPEFSRSMPNLAHQKVLDIQNSFTSQVPGKVQEEIKRFFYAKYQDKSVSLMADEIQQFPQITFKRGINRIKSCCQHYTAAYSYRQLRNNFYNPACPTSVYTRHMAILRVQNHKHAGIHGDKISFSVVENSI